MTKNLKISHFKETVYLFSTLLYLETVYCSLPLVMSTEVIQHRKIYIVICQDLVVYCHACQLATVLAKCSEITRPGTKIHETLIRRLNDHEQYYLELLPSPK